MTYQATENEFLLAVRKMSFASAASLPLSFKLGERAVRGIPTDFNPTATKKLVDGNMSETVIVGEKDGLEIRAEVFEYRDFPVVEYTVFFTNKGQVDTEILSGINAIDADFCGEAPILHYGNGDNCTADSYKFFDTPLTDTPITVSPNPDNGTSCCGASPFFRVRFEDWILTGAIGWTGVWQAIFTPNELGINLRAGQRFTNFKVLPGETLRTPRITLMITETGCETRAINMWRKFYGKHIMPKQWGENIKPKLCAHVFAYKTEEFTGATEDNQIAGLKKYIERGVHPDLWWFDAGFYPCGGKWYASNGNLYADPVRFPNNGMRPIGDACAENGVDWMVWFEPERVHRGTEIYTEHPEFLLHNAPEGQGRWDDSLLNLADPKALDWLIERIDGMIKKWKIACYRQDFGFGIGPIWRANEAPDRLGAIENLHIQGLYTLWDTLLFRNPGLYMDICASGGRRNDMEALRRAVSFQYTDVGCFDPAQKEKQHLMLFEWMPYFRAHTPGSDEFAWHVACAPAVTWMAPAWGADWEFETAKKMIPIWRRVADLELRGDYYRQMKIRYDEELTCFYCMHFYDPIKGDGVLHLIRNVHCEQEAFTAHLAVEDGYEYEVENPLTGEKFVKPASELKEFTVALEKHQGAVWFIQRI